MNALFFLVLVAIYPDHSHLVDQWPEPYITERACSTVGANLIIENRDERNVKVYCVEANDPWDLRIILNQTFNFGGREA